MQIAAFSLCVCLVFSLGIPCLPASLAHADDLSDAQATLNAAEAELATLASEYNAIQARVDEAEAQIADTLVKAEDAQQAMLEGQEELGKVMISSYKNGAATSLVDVFLQSDTIESFIRNVTYFSSIEQQKSDQIAEQRRLNEEFDTVLNELNTQKDEQEQLASEAEQKKQQAEQVVTLAATKVSSIESERARVEELQKQAASMQTSQRPEASISKDWNTGTSDESTTNKPTNNTATESNKPLPSGNGWKTGTASAYGGSSDPNTPNPGRTCTGAICNDSSMGVAIPTSWPNYKSYLGRTVEISYNGKTVFATVNDCGGMGGGSRALDLQPGVFKALGFKTCRDWGVRTVSYRFI